MRTRSLRQLCPVTSHRTLASRGLAVRAGVLEQHAMPELPEVETMRRGILTVVGSRVVAVRRTPCRLKPIQVTPAPAAMRRRAAGRVITAVGRVGKRVLVYLESADVLVFEPRMTGLVLLADPPNRAHLRLRVELRDGPAAQLLYWDRRGLGSVRLLSPGEFARQLGPEKLGPDALEITVEHLRRQLEGSRRAVKVALLDQRLVAGIGNLYASEILHLAKIHPAETCDRLKPAAWQRLHAATQSVLRDAIEHEGSTLSDGTYRNALNAPGSYQNHHQVYDREGKSCLTCGHPSVRRVVQAQRATFFCDRCQRLQ
jgi:formamidopyrimidine-DNA glycosylase